MRTKGGLEKKKKNEQRPLPVKTVVGKHGVEVNNGECILHKTGKDG